MSKKAKVDRNDIEDIDMFGVVPSSQSDERELCIAKRTPKDHDQVKDSVEAWQKGSSRTLNKGSRSITVSRANTDIDLEMNIDVGENKEDDTTSFVPESSGFECPYNCYSRGETPEPMEDNIVAAAFSASPLTPLSCLSRASTRPSTPVSGINCPPLKVGQTPLTLVTPKVSHPPTSCSPRIPSSASSVTRVSTPPPSKIDSAEIPMVLDVNLKTQQMIDRIRQNAFEAAQSSPVEEKKSYGELGELSDLSDSESELNINLRQ